MQGIEEEQIYAQLWRLDQLKKEDRERKEAEEKRKLVGETMAVLDWQKDTRTITKLQFDQMTQEERNMLQDQWKKEEEYEREMERQKFVLNRERNLELIRHNEAEKVLRDEQTLIEKQRDKGMLQQALNREKALENMEAEEKKMRRNEVVELQKHYM